MRYNDLKRNRIPNGSGPRKADGKVVRGPWSVVREETTPNTQHPTPNTQSPTAGSRPLSPVQRAYYGIPEKATPEVAPGKGRRVAGKKRGKGVRVGNSRVRKGNYLRIALGVLAAAIVFGAIGTLCFNPRFNIKTIAVEGNHAIQKEKILALAGAIWGKNIVLLPVGNIRAGILKEPTIEVATIHRTLPDSVRLVVTERQPWAAVRTADGECFTIDRRLVPFRRAAVPEQGLPVVSLGLDAAKAGVVLGKTLTAPGVADVALCLDWAKAEPDFPLESVAIAPEGKLCLNRVGGAQARLGSPVDLEQKLAALKLLLQQQPQLRLEDWEYINLYSYEAPAVKFKPVAVLAANGSAVPGDRAMDGTPLPARGPASGMEQP